MRTINLALSMGHVKSRPGAMQCLANEAMRVSVKAVYAWTYAGPQSRCQHASEICPQIEANAHCGFT